MKSSSSRCRRLFNRIDPDPRPWSTPSICVHGVVVQRWGSDDGVLRVRQEIFRAAFSANLPAVQDHHAIADVFDVREQMRTQQNRGSPSPEFQQQILHLAGADGIEAGGRLIEDQQLGIVDQRLGEPEAATHPLRVLADRPTLDLREPDHVEKFVDATLPRAAVEPEDATVVVEGLTGVEEPVQVGLLREIADLAP